MSTFSKRNPGYKATRWYNIVKAVATSKTGLTKNEIFAKAQITPPSNAANGYYNSVIHGLRDKNYIRFDRKAGVWVPGYRASSLIS